MPLIPSLPPPTATGAGLFSAVPRGSAGLAQARARQGERTVDVPELLLPGGDVQDDDLYPLAHQPGDDRGDAAVVADHVGAVGLEVAERRQPVAGLPRAEL